MAETWRVGRHFPIHIYEGEDVPVATALTAAYAKQIVADHNRASPPQPGALKLAEAALTDAWTLLQDVAAAVGKLRLRDKGASGLPHEVRIVAAAFSEPEQPKTPKHVILTGNGAARDLMKRIKEALAAIRATREGTS